MKEAEKEDAIKLIKEWQEKRPNFSRTRLAQATGVSYPTLLEFGKQGLIELPEKRHTTRKNTSWGRLGIPKEWPTK
jgi:hypothetical protein|tara:strand:- start:716 stop:943 length:228 start_codon:yes stop_codon:yes gene_type:complete